MRQSILIYLLNESDFHRPIDFISSSFFPNIAVVVAAPILKECVLLSFDDKPMNFNADRNIARN